MSRFTGHLDISFLLFFELIGVQYTHQCGISGTRNLDVPHRLHQYKNMSYQVFARKWRPSRFSDVIGQDVVVRALQNAISRNQLHHAYLFTGMRGVGKTTLARVLAKAMSCETGPQKEACGTCGICTAISSGRYPDLIEVDAASHTKVEETRNLMEGVAYAPSMGRFRIYVIDEVHMLSGHSFNALLKTLEEPPEHVKFMLATTDPQKLPVTVLSRCLQFHLRHVPANIISAYLRKSLEAEGLECEQEALDMIAENATGSVRDAISMADQAIAYGDGALRAEEVCTMLGMPERNKVLGLLKLLADGDATPLLSAARNILDTHVSPKSMLKDLLWLLHKVALFQQLGKDVEQLSDFSDLSSDETQVTSDLAKRVSPEEVQFFYQAGVLALRDLEYAPTPRVALEIGLLRMLSFMPVSDSKRVEPVQADAPQDASAPIQNPTPTEDTSAQSASSASMTDGAGMDTETASSSTKTSSDTPPAERAQLSVVDINTETPSSSESSKDLKNVRAQIVSQDKTQSPTAANIQTESNEAHPEDALKQLDADAGTQLLREHLSARIAPETLKLDLDTKMGVSSH